METYLLKFSACLVVFWLIYILFLERQNMHRFKRFYLLGAMASALLIPLLTITHYIEPVITDFEIYPVFIPMEASLEQVPLERAPFWDLEIVLWLVYGFGVLLFASRFVINLIRMYQRISENRTVAERSFIYVLLKECRIPHSFFKYIFFNKSTYETNSIPKEVLLHEETHSKQLHSIDIIILELLQIIFWFHPLMYILKHHVKLNHEFLADKAVLEQGADTKNYQNILLQFSSSDSYRNTHNHQLSSAINYSSIKKRFTVMKTQTSKTRIWLSTILLLPIIATLFYSFAEHKEVVKEPKKNIESNLFLVTVEKNENSIELKCESGCRWSHIILENRPEPYIINDFGFSEGKTIDTDIFAFSVQPNKNGIELSGLKGTDWIDLNFSLPKNQKQVINQLGMTTMPSNFEEEKTEKIITMKAINNALFIGEKKSSIDTYVKDLNEITKNWTSEDFELTTIDLKTENCSKSFLDKLNELHKNTDHFLITVLGILPNTSRHNNDILEQQKATNKQIAEYNKLAKHYNNNLGKEHTTIYLKDVERLKYIYNLMSDKQRKSAEPFPDFPEPPPPPAPVAANIEFVEEVIEQPVEIIEEILAVEEQEIIIEEVLEQKDKSLITGTHEVNGQTLYYTSKNGKTSYYNRWGQKVDNKGNILNQKQTHAEDVIEGQVVSKIYKDDKLITEFNTENVSIPPPPPPPKVPSIRELAERGAVFYYNGKEVSSKKAIKLTNENKNLNVLIRATETKKPIVKISEKPISTNRD